MLILDILVLSWIRILDIFQDFRSVHLDFRSVHLDCRSVRNCFRLTIRIFVRNPQLTFFVYLSGFRKRCLIGDRMRQTFGALQIACHTRGSHFFGPDQHRGGSKVFHFFLNFPGPLLNQKKRNRATILLPIILKKIQNEQTFDHPYFFFADSKGVRGNSKKSEILLITPGS